MSDTGVEVRSHNLFRLLDEVSTKMRETESSFEEILELRWPAGPGGVGHSHGRLRVQLRAALPAYEAEARLYRLAAWDRMGEMRGQVE